MIGEDACLEVAKVSNSRRNIVKGRRLRGEALVAQRKFDAAPAELDSALRVAREDGNPAQLWKTLAALGRQREVQGQAEAAAVPR